MPPRAGLALGRLVHDGRELLARRRRDCGGIAYAPADHTLPLRGILSHLLSPSLAVPRRPSPSLAVPHILPAFSRPRWCAWRACIPLGPSASRSRSVAGVTTRGSDRHARSVRTRGTLGSARTLCTAGTRY
eukprot:5759207-Prymnesium_polylepis.1